MYPELNVYNTFTHFSDQLKGETDKCIDWRRGGHKLLMEPEKTRFGWLIEIQEYKNLLDSIVAKFNTCLAEQAI